MELKEEFLYHIWDEGHLKNDLHTVSGKSVKVIYPGQYNTNRGPDFFNAAVIIDGEHYAGSVEIHLTTYDWTAHHHHENPYYNHVVLHVVFEHRIREPYTIREDGERVEILEIKNQLVEDIAKLFIRHKSYPQSGQSAYCDLLSLIPGDHYTSILRKYGFQRFEGKVKRFNTALLYSDFDQILYEGIMEAMGYDKNKYNMLHIAQKLTWQNLREYQAEGMGLDELVAILTVPTGLLDVAKNFLCPILAQKIQKCFEIQNFYGQKITLDWQTFRIRPANHPIYRVISICHFLTDALHKGLTESIAKLVDQNFSHRSVTKQLREFFGFTGSYLGEKIPRLGDNHLRTIFVNIILPILYLYHQKTGSARGKELICSIYETSPALADNYITNFMFKYLNPNQIKQAQKSALVQQGLIELCYRYCQYHFCDECRQALAHSTAEVLN